MGCDEELYRDCVQILRLEQGAAQAADECRSEDVQVRSHVASLSLHVVLGLESRQGGGVDQQAAAGAAFRLFRGLFRAAKLDMTIQAPPNAINPDICLPFSCDRWQCLDPEQCRLMRSA